MTSESRPLGMAGSMRELSGDTRRQVITSGTTVTSREREVTPWVRSSRSAASGWRRRSIASCSSAHGSSAAAPASSLRNRATLMAATGSSSSPGSRATWVPGSPARWPPTETRGHRRRRRPRPGTTSGKADFRPGRYPQSRHLQGDRDPRGGYRRAHGDSGHARRPAAAPR